MMPMTVRDLINALSHEDQDAKVLTDQDYTYTPVTSVEELNGRVVIR